MEYKNVRGTIFYPAAREGRVLYDRARYPDPGYSISEEAAENALDLATLVMEWVSQHMVL